MERVVEEVKSLNEQMANDRQERSRLEDDLNETQFERTKMEQKVMAFKQRQITD